MLRWTPSAALEAGDARLLPLLVWVCEASSSSPHILSFFLLF
jgi:hypothetical protein